MTRDQAVRQIAAHERAAASARDPAKRQQHYESARHYRERYGIESPRHHPPVETIFADLTRLGLDPLVSEFWLFHAGQNHPEIGHREYRKAFGRLRDAASLALSTHNRESVWIPACVFAADGESVPMQFFEVKPPPPKGEAPQFFNQSRYSK